MIRTLQEGPTYTIDGTFTMRNVLRIIDKLNTMMEYTFEPEAITEGGLFVNYGHTNSYKSFRFGFENWPILDQTMDYDLPLCVRNSTRTKNMYTSIRAFDGATPWTMDELRAIDMILNEEGLTRRVKIRDLENESY